MKVHSNGGADGGDLAIAQAVVRKVRARILPFLFICYVVAWLDRVNVGFAALQMDSRLNLGATTLGLASGIFFFGYCLCEVPSNMVLHRVGARRWIARIMITWGILSASMMFVRSATSFFVMRFLLGVAEAGFFPGVVYYLAGWFPDQHRARAISQFMAGIPVAGIFGAPVSGLLLKLDGTAGMQGWQWLFLAEGLPAVVLGVVALRVLRAGPDEVSWLSESERSWLTSTLARERARLQQNDQSVTRAVLMNPTVWALAGMFALAVTGYYGYSIWSPLMVTQITGQDSVGVGIVLGAFAVLALCGMLYNSKHSDLANERLGHVAVAHLIMGIGFLGATFLAGRMALLASLALIPLGHTAAYGPFWSVPARMLSGRAAAVGIALIATVANLGGFAGPALIGYLKEHTGGYREAMGILAALALASSALAWWLRRVVGDRLCRASLSAGAS